MKRCARQTRGSERSSACEKSVRRPAGAGGAAGSFADSVPAGVHGIPTGDQTWSATIEVRCQPSALEFSTALDFPDGVSVPRIHSVLCQAAAGVGEDTEDASSGTELVRELRYGQELILVTDGSDRSELLIDRSA